jgi:hypothetical protein
MEFTLAFGPKPEFSFSFKFHLSPWLYFCTYSARSKHVFFF